MPKIMTLTGEVWEMLLWARDSHRVFFPGCVLALPRGSIDRLGDSCEEVSKMERRELSRTGKGHSGGTEVNEVRGSGILE